MMERVLGNILCHLDPKVKVKVKVMYFLVTLTIGHSNFNLCKCIIRYSYLVTVSPPVVCNVRSLVKLTEIGTSLGHG